MQNWETFLGHGAFPHTVSVVGVGEDQKRDMRDISFRDFFTQDLVGFVAIPTSEIDPSTDNFSWRFVRLCWRLSHCDMNPVVSVIGARDLYITTWKANDRVRLFRFDTRVTKKFSLAAYFDLVAFRARAGKQFNLGH